MLPTLLVLALIVTAGLFALWQLRQRGLELRALAHNGRRITGRVAERRARHSQASAGRQRRVQLEYTHADAGVQRRWIAVSMEEWERLQADAPVELVYLPDRPSVFAMLTLVNRVRAAQGLQPLT